MVERIEGRWRYLATALAVAVTLAIIAGCGGGEGTTTTGATGEAPATTAAETGTVAAATTASEAIRGEGKVVLAEFGGAYSKAIVDTLAKPFSEATGYDMTVVDTTDRVQKPLAMVESGNVEWDLLEALDTEAVELADKGALEPIPADVKAQMDAVLNPGSTTDYGVAISSYGDVYACNKEAVSACPANAVEFFDTAAFPGRRAIQKEAWLTNIVMALIADGVPPDQLFPLDVDRALAKWNSLKDEVAVYYTTADQWQQLLRDGEVDMGVGPDGRTWNMLEEGLDLSISYQGQPYRVDYFVVLKGAPNSQGAFDFMLWYATNPKAQANFAEQMIYGVPNPAAYDFIDPETAQKLVDFPANKEQTIPVDFAWIYENGAAASKAWADYLAG